MKFVMTKKEVGHGVTVEHFTNGVDKFVLKVNTSRPVAGVDIASMIDANGRVSGVFFGIESGLFENFYEVITAGGDCSGVFHSRDAAIKFGVKNGI